MKSSPPLSFPTTPSITGRIRLEGHGAVTVQRDGVIVWLLGRVDALKEGDGNALPSSRLAQAEAILDYSIRYGGDSIAHATGQFVIGIEVGDTLTCFRSHLSPVSLFYSSYRVSDDLKTFLADGFTSPNHNYFARYLVDPNFLQYQSDLSPLANIRRLRPGHKLTLRNGKAEVSPYDSFSESLHWDFAQKEEDVVPEIDRLFHEIISESIASHHGPIACELSGGLDSSYVNCVVADKYRNHPAIMYSYAERPSHQFSENCAEIVAREKKLNLRIVGVKELEVPNLSTAISYRQEPSLMFWQGELFGPVLQKHIAPNSLLFTGYGADQIFMRSTEVLLYYLRRGDWRGFSKMAKEMGRALERSRINLMFQSLFCQIPLNMRIRIPSVFSVEDIVSAPTSAKLVGWMRPRLSEFRERHQPSFEHVDHSYLTYPSLVMGTYLTAANIDHTHPFCDSRLIRLMRQKVSAHLIHDFSRPYKHLLRQAQTKWVPADVRNRKKNEFRFDGFYSMVLKRNASFLRKLIMEAPTFVDDFVDRKEALKAFEQLQFGVFSPSTFYLEQLIAYLMWWRRFRG